MLLLTLTPCPFVFLLLLLLLLPLLLLLLLQDPLNVSGKLISEFHHVKFVSDRSYKTPKSIAICCFGRPAFEIIIWACSSHRPLAVS
jgi:hypothetical protein